MLATHLKRTVHETRVAPPVAIYDSADPVPKECRREEAGEEEGANVDAVALQRHSRLSIVA